MPSPRRNKSSVDYLDDHISEDESSHDRSTRPRGYAPKLQRGVSDTSLMTRERRAADIDNNDSQFESDTDYNPRDKYYLSDEEDPLDSRLSERAGTARSQSEREHKSHSRHGSSRHGSSSRSGQAHSRSHGSSHEHQHHHHSHHRHSHSHSHSQSHSRDLDEEDHTDRHKSSVPPSKSSSHASRPRPRPSRASSSYLNAVRRPQMKRAGSSYKSASRTRTRARPRPVRSLSNHGRKPHAGKPKSNKMPWEDFPWEDAAKVAIQAGGVALMKVGTEQMPWRAKGTKIASAALGAAVVDHVLKPDKRGGVKYTAIRHLTEIMLGNMVVSPALGKMGAGKKR